MINPKSGSSWLPIIINRGGEKSVRERPLLVSREWPGSNQQEAEHLLLSNPTRQRKMAAFHVGHVELPGGHIT